MVVGSAQARAVGRNINRFDESRLQQVQNSLCCVRFENIPAEATILFRWQVEGFSLGLHIRVKMFLDQLYYGCFSAPMLFRVGCLQVRREVILSMTLVGFPFINNLAVQEYFTA